MLLLLVSVSGLNLEVQVISQAMQCIYFNRVNVVKIHDEICAAVWALFEV